MNAAPDEVSELLRSLRRRGIRLWSEMGELRYRAAPGAVSRADLEALRRLKPRVVSLLESLAEEPRLQPRDPDEQVPLTWSQMAHLHWLQLRDAPSFRQVAGAIHLRGHLDPGALREAFVEVVQRHEALRTRIVRVDGHLTQQVVDSARPTLVLADLTRVEESSVRAEIVKHIEQVILEPVDLSTGPLSGLRLLKVHREAHVLVAAMDHVISDAASLRVLLQDLLAAYSQAVAGQTPCLPQVPIQFPDYSVWQARMRDAWHRRHGGYWNQRMGGYRETRFPVDARVEEGSDLGWGVVPLRIPGQLKSALTQWCIERKTTLAMSVFTAYVALVLRWCGERDIVVHFETSGRTTPLLEDAIGYFASALHLRIEVGESETFLDLAHRVKDEYCRAFEHFDAGFLEALEPRQPYTRGSLFNWVPVPPDAPSFQGPGSGKELLVTPVSFDNPALQRFEFDRDPSILLFDKTDEISGGVYFSRQRFSPSAMRRLGADLVHFCEAMVRDPSRRISAIPLHR